MAAVAQVPHFGLGSNIVDGPASIVDLENAVFRDLVNRIRSVLAQDLQLSGIYKFGWFESHLRIRNMVSLYNEGLFYRAVIESCNQEYDNDNDFKRLVLRHLLPINYFHATMINEYLSTMDLINATELISILSSSEIQQIKGVYPLLFGRDLEDDIETFTVGEHRETLLEYIRIASVPERNDLRAEVLSREQLEEILSYLHKNLKETVKRPRMAFGKCVFGLREEHMRAVVNGYHEKYGRPLEKDLTRANYGHVEHAFKTKILCAVDLPGYLAGVVFHNLKVVPNRATLHEAFGAMRDPNIEGMTDADHFIDYKTIVRVITTVAEGDMMMMKEKYRLKSGFTLEDDISVAFEDRQDCLQLILMILNPNAPY